MGEDRQLRCHFDANQPSITEQQNPASIVCSRFISRLLRRLYIMVTFDAEKKTAKPVIIIIIIIITISTVNVDLNINNKNRKIRGR